MNYKKINDVVKLFERELGQRVTCDTRRRYVTELKGQGGLSAYSNAACNDTFKCA